MCCMPKVVFAAISRAGSSNTKRLMWSTGLVLKLRKSCDGLVRLVVLRSPNGNIINRAIQCLYPLEIRNDKKPEGRDVEEETRPEPATNPPLAEPVEPIIDPALAGPVEPIADPALPDPELPDLVAAEVEPNGMCSCGEHVGNLLIPPTRITRSGQTSRPPQRLNDYCLRGPLVAVFHYSKVMYPFLCVQ